MMRVSLGMSASTSVGEKYRSATKAPVHEDRVHFLGPVNPAGQGELDVGGPARARDEIDDGARGGRGAVSPPGPGKNARLGERPGRRPAIHRGGVAGRP